MLLHFIISLIAVIARLDSSCYADATEHVGVASRHGVGTAVRAPGRVTDTLSNSHSHRTGQSRLSHVLAESSLDGVSFTCSTRGAIYVLRSLYVTKHIISHAALQLTT